MVLCALYLTILYIIYSSLIPVVLVKHMWLWMIIISKHPLSVVYYVHLIAMLPVDGTAKHSGILNYCPYTRPSHTAAQQVSTSSTSWRDDVKQPYPLTVETISMLVFLFYPLSYLCQINPILRQPHNNSGQFLNTCLSICLDFWSETVSDRFDRLLQPKPRN